MRLHTRICGAQKRISRTFQRNLGRHGLLISRPQRGNFSDPLLQILIIRVNGHGKCGIGRCVFMGAINLRAIGQCIELLQTVPHLRHRALKNAPTAQHKKTVPDKSMAVQMISNMPQSMAANIQHMGLVRTQPHHIALINGTVKAGDFIGFTGRAANDAACGPLNLFIIAGMVIMVMGVPNLRQLPACLIQRRHNRRRFRRINAGCLAAFGIMHQKAVIITETGKLVNL